MFVLVYSPNGILSDQCEASVHETLGDAHAAMVWHVDSLLGERDPDFDDYGIFERGAYMDGDYSDGAEWQIIEL